MTARHADRPRDLSFEQLQRELRSGEISAQDVVRDCLAAIDEAERDVHAWVHVDAEGALAAARELDALPAADRGPLHGIPVGLKDVIDTASQPTEYGSRVYAGHRPTTDAAAVIRLREAGAIMIGKTVTTEFASWAATPTRHPRDASRTAGASSSGSAAAVAAGMTPIALGTQTVGSTIRPASFCGVAGMKATHGRLDLTGFKRTSARLDTLGLFARNVAGLATTWRALSVPAGVSPTITAVPPPVRVRFSVTPWWDEAEQSSQDALRTAADLLAAVETDLPVGFADVIDAHDIIATADTSHALLPEYRTSEHLISDQLRTKLAEGLAVTPAAYDDATRTANRVRGLTSAFFDDVDVLVMPAVVGEAVPAEQGTGNPLFCRPWSMLGNPVVTVPVTTGPAGLPIGVQIVARYGDDHIALDVAARLETLLSAS